MAGSVGSSVGSSVGVSAAGGGCVGASVAGGGAAVQAARSKQTAIDTGISVLTVRLSITFLLTCYYYQDVESTITSLSQTGRCSAKTHA
jgi:hypothetical protein